MKSSTVARASLRCLRGAAVCALLAGGGYAEYAVAPAVQCLPIPEGIGVHEAAALPETFFTVYHNIFERAQLRAGETLLVHGGSSGIGTTAIKLAKAFDARVIVTAGSDEKCAACVALGAERAINYRTEDFVLAVKEATGWPRRRCHSRYGWRGLSCPEHRGNGDRGTNRPDRDARRARGAARSALPVSEASESDGLHIAPAIRRAEGTARPSAALARLAVVASHELQPPIHARFPLVDARRAHELMESSQHIGKILLDVL